MNRTDSTLASVAVTERDGAVLGYILEAEMTGVGEGSGLQGAQVA